MRRLLIGLIAAATLLAGGLGAQQRRPQEVELQAAIRTETVDRDLTRAIAQYRAIVTKYSADRPMVAQALVRMAGSYQKLGDAQARTIYERIVKEFADQQEAVAIANAQLGRSDSPTVAAMASRRLWTPPAGSDLGGKGSAISHDGRFLTYIDQTMRSDLAVHDFVTGRDRLLTNSTGSRDYVLGSVMSRDGKQVAYTWVRPGVNRGELRLASLEGTGLPQSRLLFANEDVSWITPFDWSPDSNWIAVQLTRGDRTDQLGLISVRDGSLRVLKSSEWRGATQLFFSPDGKYLGFDLPVGETATGQRDVFMLAVDGSRQTPAVVGASDDTMMGWSPDGKYLLFASDRRGPVGLWAMPIADGRPIGIPELLKPDIPRLSLGVSASGSLFMGVDLGGRDIEIATLDLETGKLTGKPVKPIQRFVGSNDWPDWSPDGKYLSYFSRRSVDGRTRVLGILSVETGQVREVEPKLNYFQTPRWAPDGRSVIVQGQDLKNLGGVYQIDAQNGDAVRIGEGRDAQMSSDGKKLYSMVGPRGVVERDLASGNEREIIRRESRWMPGAGVSGSQALSPDGRSIATIYEDQSTKSNVVLLVPVSGGEPRELLRVSHPEAPYSLYCLAWTPDGRAVLVTRESDRGELLLVPAAGGPPRKIDVGTTSVACPSVHPDGRQIAFVAHGGGKSEVWVLENFLPAPTANK